MVRVYKGLYATVALTQLDPLELGQAIIHRYTYLSTESVLVQAGIITQTIYYYTFISGLSKKISIGTTSFWFRQLKDNFLYNTDGIYENNGILTATVERAIADMLYFAPHYHFDMSENIDYPKVKELQEKIGYI